MTLEVWYWLIIAIWLIFGYWRRAPAVAFPTWIGGTLIELLLFVIIGWRIFGAPIK